MVKVIAKPPEEHGRVAIFAVTLADIHASCRASIEMKNEKCFEKFVPHIT